MDLYTAIQQRRTFRKFLTPPTAEQLQKLLEAGALAPSAGNKQAWHVVIVENQETREKIGDIKYRLNQKFMSEKGKSGDLLRLQKEAFYNCTTLVFYTFAPEPNDPHRYDMGSCWLLVENICLSATAEGLGTMIFALWEEGEEQVNQLLRIPPKMKLVTGLNIGVPDPSYIPNKKILKPTSKWIFREKWMGK